MPIHLRHIFFGAILTFTASFSLLAADTSAVSPNSDPTYQQLRNLTLSGEAVAVSNLDLHRDAATFHLRSGTVCFVTPVAGKVTGAVFVGDGNFVLDPPSAQERSMLKLLTKEDSFSENFSQMVLRFTDTTYDEMKKGSGAAAGGCEAGPLRDSQNATRHNRELKFNLEARILEDVLSPEPGGLFVAFVHGKRYNSKELFTIDPHSSDDQVELLTYDENKLGNWAGFHISERGAGGLHQNRIHIEHQQLDTTIEKSAELTGKATTTFVALNNGLRVVPFRLFHELRVDSVKSEGAMPLTFIQEDKSDDADFAVILPKALAAGEKYTVTTSYNGKEAVIDEGGGNYYPDPRARMSWFPNNRNGGFGEYTSYDMTFHIPKGMKIAATGELLKETNEGGENETVWKSGPQTVAGFNFGKFKVEEAKLPKPEYLVQSFANEEPPAWVTRLQHIASGDDRRVKVCQDVSDRNCLDPRIYGKRSDAISDKLTMDRGRTTGAALGSLDTTDLNKKALGEGQLATELYTEYFGPSSFKHLSITQQSACNFGQSWPQLVWIPLCYFFDDSVRHQLGLDWRDRGYWRAVVSHEVAHQWWGDTVGFSSYRDQWMSEGFANFSAALYLQAVYSKEPQRYFDFWKDERELLVERNKEGFRPIDAGALTLGYRLNTSRTGNIYNSLIYAKGAYVLHMIRMMMWDRKAGDQNFKAMMQDFVKTYTNTPATTEDFKAMVEKHMTPDMDLDGNHRLDWFFNQYVYGTALPAYNLESSFDKDANGDVLLGFKVTQSGVDDKFRMLVPIYIELADGRVVLLGRVRPVGNMSVDQKVPLKGVKDLPKRALLNYNYDVLAAN
jgi:Peptidase family M1 domain